MSIWISIPSVVTPPLSKTCPDNGVDPLYQRIYHAYSRSTEIIKDGLLLPRACGENDDQLAATEELAAVAVRSLLSNRLKQRLPTMLVDCRTSAATGGAAPTYKLAVRVGLRKIIPFSLSGQGGTEVVQALIFLQHMSAYLKMGVIISAVQRVVPPDARLKENGFPLADGAAAVFVTNSPNSINKCMQIKGVAIGQQSSDGDIFENVLNKATEKFEIRKDDIKWSIAHRFSRTFLSSVKEISPNAAWVERNKFKEIDFGCADPLISISQVFNEPDHPFNGIGVVWFVGKFGAIGALLLKFYRSPLERPQD